MKRTAVIILAVILCAVPAQAQELGALVDGYTFSHPTGAGLSRAELLWTPFSVSVPLGGRLAGDLSGGFARAVVVGPSGGDATLTSLTDTRVGVRARLAHDHLVVRAAASLPTAAETQSLAEARVMGVLATELLPWQTGPWTGGGGLAGSAEGSFDLAGVAFRVLGGYTRWQARHILAGDTLSYRPGDELQVRAVADVPVSRTGVLSVLVGLRTFQADAGGGLNIFRSGTRLETFVSYAFPLGLSGSAVAYGGISRRGQGEELYAVDFLPGIANAPSYDLVQAGFDLRIPRGRLTILPQAEIRVLRGAQGLCAGATDQGGAPVALCPSGQGWLLSAGAAVEKPLGNPEHPRFVLAPIARVRIGQVVHWGSAGSGGGTVESASSGVIGWEVGITARVRGSR
jgi:hypothetical protein